MDQFIAKIIKSTIDEAVANNIKNLPLPLRMQNSLAGGAPEGIQLCDRS